MHEYSMRVDRGACVKEKRSGACMLLRLKYSFSFEVYCLL